MITAKEQKPFVKEQDSIVDVMSTYMFLARRHENH